MRVASHDLTSFRSWFCRVSMTNFNVARRSIRMLDNIARTIKGQLKANIMLSTVTQSRIKPVATTCLPYSPWPSLPRPSFETFQTCFILFLYVFGKGRRTASSPRYTLPRLQGKSTPSILLNLCTMICNTAAKKRAKSPMFTERAYR